MFKLQDEDSAAAAPLFAEAALLPHLERSPASFYKPLRVEQSNNRAVKTYIPVFFPFVFILALFFSAIYSTLPRGRTCFVLAAKVGYYFTPCSQLSPTLVPEFFLCIVKLEYFSFFFI